MATIRDLFKEQNKELYGLSGKAIIESRGLINPPRGAALLASSPNTLADLIGNQVGGALKGSANRPSDTIFKSDGKFQKPITLGKTQVGVKDAIEKDTAYFVKQNPAPASIIAKITQGGSSPVGLAGAAAVSAINKFGSKNALKELSKSLKEKENGNGYGKNYQVIEEGKKPLTKDIKYSEYAPYYEKKNVNEVKDYAGDYVQTEVKKRTNKDFNTINSEILTILTTDTTISNAKINTFFEKNKQSQLPYVLIQKYGKQNDNILLPGTISGISEEATPEWSTFKYVGSPFNNYRYLGVEKTIQFELKMYYLDEKTKTSMKKSLDKLRNLVYPDENISVVTYPNNGGYSPMNFNGNLIYLTINGLYDNLFGFIETLSISIEDTAPWSTTSDDYMNGSDVKPYPTIINVTIGMKVINNPEVKDNKYIFNHTSTPLDSINITEKPLEIG
jgi:hypothetical protein